MSRLLTAALITVAAAMPFPALAQSAGGPAMNPENQGYYRFPALFRNTIVFAAEGDLWRIGVSGGVAQRLTTHPGEETYPRISPDGAMLAFTAGYEGPAEVYTMPLAGGLPVRRTYEAETSTATTWTPDGRLVYTTTHYSTLPKAQMVALDLAENRVDRIPLYTAAEGVYDETGDNLFFVRPAFHNNVTKRYRGDGPGRLEVRSRIGRGHRAHRRLRRREPLPHGLAEPGFLRDGPGRDHEPLVHGL